LRLDPGLLDRRVLVVEDEYTIAEDLCRELFEAGAVVVGPASTLGKAMALLLAEPRLDCAVLDINLGGEMVFPVADALAARGVPFIFVTGYDAGLTPERYSAILHCEKPVEPAAVARELCFLLLRA
jgi:CheY-like chemotaxis protein